MLVLVLVLVLVLGTETEEYVGSLYLIIIYHYLHNLISPARTPRASSRDVQLPSHSTSHSRLRSPPSSSSHRNVMLHMALAFTTRPRDLVGDDLSDLGSCYGPNQFQFQTLNHPGLVLYSSLCSQFIQRLK